MLIDGRDNKYNDQDVDTRFKGSNPALDNGRDNSEAQRLPSDRDRQKRREMLTS